MHGEKVKTMYDLMIDLDNNKDFPKALPLHAVGGNGADLFLYTSFNLVEWLEEQNCVLGDREKYRLFVQKNTMTGIHNSMRN